VSKLHGVANEAEASDATSFAKEEFYQMRVQVAADERMAANETVWTLFTKPSYRKRMICAFLTMFGAESTGILVIYSEFSSVIRATDTANAGYRLQCPAVRRPRIQG
jgi:hypothetical protein